MRQFEDLEQEQEYKQKRYYALIVFKSGKKDVYMGTKWHFDVRKKYWEEIDTVKELTSDEYLSTMRNRLGLNNCSKAIIQSDKDKKQRTEDYRYLKSGY